MKRLALAIGLSALSIAGGVIFYQEIDHGDTVTGHAEGSTRGRNGALTRSEARGAQITATPTQTADISATATATSESTQGTAGQSQPATPTSEVSSNEQGPTQQTAVVAGDLSQLPLPPGTRVSYTGCASDGTCYWYNFYWAPTHEVVLQGDEEYNRYVHELCHAHQHWSINGGAPTSIDLSAWYGTAEAASYGAIATGWPYYYDFTTAPSLLEDFAEACALYYVIPSTLMELSPARYEWMATHLQ